MILLRGISKTYGTGPGAVKALNNITLTIRKGEFTAIMGASGSGKSTLMHILGLLDTPDAGTYTLCGMDTASLNDDERTLARNHLMGFVFQKFYLMHRLSALHNVSLPLIYGRSSGRLEKVAARLARVGLSERLKHKPSELSGGQQQRTAVARALVTDPSIIFADEPTGNLDSANAAQIIALLRELNAEGTTIILVTHDPEIAAATGRVIRMRDGEIVEDSGTGHTDSAANDVHTQGPLLKDTLSDRRSRPGAAFADNIRQSVASIASNKTRSFLSVLGVLIGVSSVVAMLALGAGAKKAINERLLSLGANALSVRPGSAKVHGVSTASGSLTRFTFKDADAIRELPYVKTVVPRVSGSVQSTYGNKNWTTQVDGVTPEYENMKSATPFTGTFFTQQDQNSRAKTAVLGMTVYMELFGSEPPVGRVIKLNRIDFRVTGVMPSKGQGGFRDQDDVIIVPVTTAMRRLFGKDYLDGIDVDVTSPDKTAAVQAMIEDLLRKRHRIALDDTEKFYVRDMTQIKEALGSTTKTMTWLLSSVAVISLLVGGIGIMNIMLVSVTERTNEIGLRKAVGARKSDIMRQFLIESALLTSSGGFAGILSGVCVTLLLARLAGWSVQISPESIAVPFTFSAGVGVVFGLWPASKAARLNPIDALRYE